VHLISKIKPNKNSYFFIHNAEKLLHGYLAVCQFVLR